MSEHHEPEYHGARFYKCALQVNPFAYAKRHGKDPGAPDEATYNTAMARACIEAGVSVVALANHGDVDESESLRKILRANGITVFPGFEIASAEKIHMVCFFPGESPDKELNRFLGAISGSHAKVIGEEATYPSSLSLPAIAEMIDDFGGAWYAAHIDGECGILQEGRHDLWKQHDLVRAGALTKDLADVSPCVRAILDNKNSDYKRERPIAVIHANDVKNPENIHKPRHACWIKMTGAPAVDSLRQAFFDPESRIALSEPQSSVASRITSVKWSGGGLFRDSEVELSENLNAVIGGRGAGKSSLLESIRYALMLQPIGDDAVKFSNDIVSHNFANSTVTVGVWSQKEGKHFTISRRQGFDPQVRTDSGEISNRNISDIIPRVDMLAQNEISEISGSKRKMREVLEKFLPSGLSFANDIQGVRDRLRDNREQLLKLERELDDIQQITGREKALTEQLGDLETAGIEEKLEKLSRVAEERLFCEKFDGVEARIGDWLAEWDDIANSLPPPKDWDKLPNGGALADIHRLFSDATKTLAAGRDTMHQETEKLRGEFSRRRKLLKENWEALQDEINHFAGQLPPRDGLPGDSVISRYKHLRAQIDAVESAKEVEQKKGAALDAILKHRQELLAQYKDLHFTRYNGLRAAAERFNNGELKGKVRIDIESMHDRGPLKKFIADAVEGVREGSVKWLDDASGIDPVKMAQRIRDRDAAGFRDLFSDSQPTLSVAKKIVGMSRAHSYELEEVAIDDVVVVSLNLAPPDTTPNFRPIDNLSPGQKCTAILSLFLLGRDAPLVLDQPEDHLDNAFIAGHIAEKIRQIKKDRQVIVSTHNANIPVLGDAELIAVLEPDADGGNPVKNELLGPIDMPEVQQKTAVILDGGREAFIIRKEKYGY